MGNNVNKTMLAAVIIPNLGGWVGEVITRLNLSWYGSLIKPEWTPPNWLFTPMWTYLYSSIGYASYLVYKELNENKGHQKECYRGKFPLILYGTNLVLNWIWTPIFFGTHQMKLAFFELNMVNLTAIAAAYVFYKVKPLSGYLLVPYISWLLYATVLNWELYNLNRPDGPKIIEIKEE